MKINKKIKGISLSEKYNIPADELEKLVYGIHGDIYDCRDVMRAVRLYQSQLPSPFASCKKANLPSVLS
jgi:hypothetical protein